jgi:hypothetical protein
MQPLADGVDAVGRRSPFRARNTALTETDPNPARVRPALLDLPAVGTPLAVVNEIIEFGPLDLLCPRWTRARLGRSGMIPPRIGIPGPGRLAKAGLGTQFPLMPNIARGAARIERPRLLT